MDDFEEKECEMFAAFMPLPTVAWQMFAQTGMPGYYMLYSDLTRGEVRDPLD